LRRREKRVLLHYDICLTTEKLDIFTWKNQEEREGRERVSGMERRRMNKGEVEVWEGDGRNGAYDEEACSRQ
jgi:hypothetical protein